MLQIYSFTVLDVRSPKWIIEGYNQGIRWPRSFWKPQEKIHLLPLPVFRGCSIPWLIATSLQSLLLSSRPISPSYKDPCENKGSTRVIQNNTPFSFIYLFICSFICPSTNIDLWSQCLALWLQQETGHCSGCGLSNLENELLWWQQKRNSQENRWKGTVKRTDEKGARDNPLCGGHWCPESLPWENCHLSKELREV